MNKGEEEFKEKFEPEFMCPYCMPTATKAEDCTVDREVLIQHMINIHDYPFDTT